MNLESRQPAAYDQQLQDKLAQTQLEFSDLGATAIEVFASPPEGYRMRAEFKIWHEGDTISYVMFGPGPKKSPYVVERFHPGSTKLQQLMADLLPLLQAEKLLERKLFQVEFLSSTLGDAVVTLVYHKPLTPEWEFAALKLADQLGVPLIGRSRKQKLVIGRDHVFEEFEVAGKLFRYQQLEGSFTQPNASVCEKMLNWAARHSQGTGGDLLELYCGNGNFTIPLSNHFERVLATEIAKSSIRSAEFNCELNNITNIQFVRMSSEELTQAMNGVRPFRRLEGINLSDYRFSTVLVDPPRAGLDAATTDLIAGVDNIIYISCNPITLRRDIEQLQSSHTVRHMALFDQFPYTEHRECGVILTR